MGKLLQTSREDGVILATRVGGAANLEEEGWPSVTDRDMDGKKELGWPMMKMAGLHGA